MIGQENLRRFFSDKYISSHKPMPKSMMFIGAKGSGKKTFIKWLSDLSDIPIVEIGQKAEDVRLLSEMCYNSVKMTMYLIPDVEQMSAIAQNSLLKILEEPPVNTILILTVAQENTVLPTITSRCVKFYMDKYSESELLQYSRGVHQSNGEFDELMLKICVCPGDIDLLFSQDISEFQTYVKRVFNNIAKVTGANSFKIGNKINLSDENKKFDLGLFWRAFISECFENVNADQKYLKGVVITQKYLQELRVKGINKQMLFDCWILDIRKEWL